MALWQTPPSPSSPDQYSRPYYPLTVPTLAKFVSSLGRKIFWPAWASRLPPVRVIRERRDFDQPRSPSLAAFALRRNGLWPPAQKLWHSLAESYPGPLHGQT